MAAWNPGLMSVGGIPNRTTIYKTLSPSGGDDSGAIQAALNSAPAGQVVMLNPGTFVVNNLLLIHRPITLRGSGAGMTKLKRAWPVHLASVRERVFDHVDPATVKKAAQALSEVAAKLEDTR